MYERQVLKVGYFIVLLFFVSGCQSPDFSNLKKAPSVILDLTKVATRSKRTSSQSLKHEKTIPLGEMLDGSLADTNSGSNFAEVIVYAIDSDPAIIAKRRNLESKLAEVGANIAQKEFQVGTTFYAGIEDITDDTKGAALAVNASRLIFDGGRLDSQIDSARFAAVSANMNLTAAVNDRAYSLCEIWLELEKYRKLQQQIDKRIAVLDPLIVQLERVAEAGIGDVSKVAAAQRTVSAIRIEQTSIAEGLIQAETAFLNSFGDLREEIPYDHKFITSLVPTSIDDEMIKSAPLIRAQYAAYQASLARVSSLKAKGGFNVGFEASALKPFAGSGYDSDEKVGLVARKTLFNGGMFEAEIQQAEAEAQAGVAQIQVTYRTGVQTVEMARKNIQSMDRAILIANKNAKLTSDEIVYLKQQLIIGGSTLDSVLSAEARLYEAESKEIKFLTEKHKSELIIVSSLGVLSNALGF